MNITEVKVSAGRTIDNPYESYSNFRPEITLTADLKDEANKEHVIKLLQEKAENLLSDHIKKILSMAKEKEDKEQAIKEAEMKLRALKGDDLPF